MESDWHELSHPSARLCIVKPSMTDSAYFQSMETLLLEIGPNDDHPGGHGDALQKSWPEIVTTRSCSNGRGAIATRFLEAYKNIPAAWREREKHS